MRARSFTPNQIVAVNLTQLRHERGLTQTQAGELVGAFLAAPLSKASWSAIETSPDPGARPREFTTEEMIAFARAFGVHPLELLLPPVSVVGRTKDGPRHVARVLTADRDDGLDLAEFLDLLLEPSRLDRLGERLDDLIAQLPPTKRSRYSPAALAKARQRGTRRRRLERELRATLESAARLAAELDEEDR